MTLLETSPWLTVISLIFGSSGIFLYILGWIRFRKKDTAEINNKNANTIKTEAESEKVKAEAEKVKAEAVEIKTKADATVADVALKLAQRLSEECNLAKIELKEKETTLEKTQEDLDSVRKSLRDALERIDVMEVELNREKEEHALMQIKNKAMWTQVIELTAEINKLKKEIANNSNGN